MFQAAGVLEVAGKEGRPLMFAALRAIPVTLAVAVRHVAGLVSPRRLAEQTILRSKHWPSDGIARQAFLAAAAIAAVALLAMAVSPDHVASAKMVWS
jgi:hypothetical protein